MGQQIPGIPHYAVYGENPDRYSWQSSQPVHEENTGTDGPETGTQHSRRDTGTQRVPARLGGILRAGTEKHAGTKAGPLDKTTSPGVRLEPVAAAANPRA